MRSRAGGAGDLGPLWTAIRSLDPRSACPSRDGIQTGNVHRALRDSAHHWLVVAMAEMLTDPERKIARPRQVWIGHETREFVPIEKGSTQLRSEDAGQGRKLHR